MSLLSEANISFHMQVCVTLWFKDSNMEHTLPKLPFPRTLWNVSWLSERRAWETVVGVGVGAGLGLGLGLFPLSPAVNAHLQTLSK